ncbi:hypothetical protein CMU21_14665 [Elizabethkingia anophelis]|nr:hypothetical protein [Elizabethkingia anophelis]
MAVNSELIETIKASQLPKLANPTTGDLIHAQGDDLSTTSLQFFIDKINNGYNDTMSNALTIPATGYYRYKVINPGTYTNITPNITVSEEEIKKNIVVISVRDNVATKELDPKPDGVDVILDEVSSKNKYDSKRNKINFWISPETGKLNNENNPNYIVSDFIIADEYNYLSRPFLYNYFAVAYYAADKTTPLKPLDVNGNQLPYEVVGQKNIALKKPEGAKYIVFTVAFGDPNEESRDIQIESGTSFTGYEPYSDPKEALKPELTEDFELKDNIITVENSDKLAWYGCSYTESFYTLKGKSWINKLSNMLDLPLGNFAVSGNTMIELNNKIKNNFNPFHPTIGIKQFKPSHVVMANIGNEATHIFGNYADMYLNEVKESVSLIKSLGAKPILGTDWCIENHSVDALLSDYSEKNNIPYYGIGSDVEQVSKQKFDNFWYYHPGVRTNAPIWLGWLPFISKLQPKQSIKVFRSRNADETIVNLNYDNNFQRVKNWQEINVGEFALNSGTSEDYFDKLWDRDNYTSSAVINEYCKLINKESVQFSKKALLEFIIPKVKVDSIKIKIKSYNAGLTFFAKNTLSTAIKYDDLVGQALLKVDKATYDLFATEVNDAVYVISEKPSLTFRFRGRIKSDALGGYFLSFKSSTNYDFPSQEVAGTMTRQSDNRVSNYISTSPLSKHSYSAYTAIMGIAGNFESVPSTYDNGYHTIELKNYSYLDYDKVRLIVSNSGNFDISDISCEYNGGVDKIINDLLSVKRDTSKSVLTSITGFGQSSYNNSYELTSGATWRKIGAVNQYPSFNTDESYIELGYNTEGFPAKMKRSFTVDKSRQYREMIVKVTSRINPKVYDLSRAEDDNFTHTPQVTKTSFDYATLCAGVHVDGSFPFTTQYTNPTPYSISRSFVDLSWTEITFKFLISPYSENINLMIWRDENDSNKNNPLQVCDIQVLI